MVAPKNLSHAEPQCNGKQNGGKNIKEKNPNIKPHQAKKNPRNIYPCPKPVSSTGNVEKNHETPKTLSQKRHILENRLYVR